MRVGELADAAGVTATALRFYERRGLLASPARRGNGYRDYSPAAAQRVAFIRSAQAAGLTLAEIRGILRIRDSGRAPCVHVTDLVDAKIADVRRRMAELSALEQTLRTVRDRGRDLDPVECDGSEICVLLSPDDVRPRERRRTPDPHP